MWLYLSPPCRPLRPPGVGVKPGPAKPWVDAGDRTERTGPMRGAGGVRLRGGRLGQVAQLSLPQPQLLSAGLCLSAFPCPRGGHQPRVLGSSWRQSLRPSDPLPRRSRCKRETLGADWVQPALSGGEGSPGGQAGHRRPNRASGQQTLRCSLQGF